MADDGAVTEPAARPSTVGRPPRTDAVLMAVGIVAVSTSGPLMAAIVAPALAVALWRNVLAIVAIWPVALVTRRPELRRLTRRELQWATGAGVLLALHFATWVPSLRYTSVASATAHRGHPAGVGRADRPRLGPLHPAPRLAGHRRLAVRGHRADRRRLLAGPARRSSATCWPCWAAIFAALYTVAGAEVRRTVTTTTYTALCYSTAAVALLVACLIGGVQLWGFSGQTWLQLLALTLGAQLLGHSVFNMVLRSTSPTVVSLALLLEIPGAALIAAVGARPDAAAGRVARGAAAAGGAGHRRLLRRRRGAVGPGGVTRR